MISRSILKQHLPLHLTLQEPRLVFYKGEVSVQDLDSQLDDQSIASITSIVLTKRFCKVH
eukprot:c38058_g1_i1 orf=1-177(-)